MGLVPGSGRSPGVGNGNPLQDSCLENHGQQVTIHNFTKSWTQVSRAQMFSLLLTLSLLRYDTQSTRNSRRIDKLNYIEIRDFCAANDIIEKVKR